MRLFTSALLCASLGCGSSLKTVRTDKPLELSSGAPLNECELREWYELVPTHAFSSARGAGPISGFALVPTIKRETRGFGIYLFAERTPLDLATFLPKLELPELTAVHMGRIQGIHTREALTTTIAILALGVTLGAIALMAAIPTAEVLGVVLLIVALAVDLWNLTLIPRIDELTYARLRDSVLLPDEDDIPAVVEAVTRLNERRRAQCSGHP